MSYYMKTDGEYILAVSTTNIGEEIEESLYSAILHLISSMPSPSGGIAYKLKTDLTIEECNIVPVEDDVTAEDKAEAYDILMGVSE